MSIGGGYNTNEFVADFYDLIPGYKDRGDVDFYVNAAKESKGPVLEVCCGTGRLLIPTAREHVQITGLDLSGYMLNLCRQKLELESENVSSYVRLVEADMRDFDIDTEFGLATVPFRSFQHLTTVDDQCACLRTVHRHLNKNGRIILDLFNPWLKVMVEDNIGIEQGPDSEFSLDDGSRVTRYHKFVSKDLIGQINQMEMIYYVTQPDGQKERLVHPFPMRYLFRYEAEHLLYRCGFKVLYIYADFKKKPFGSKYPGELILIGEKQ